MPGSILSLITPLRINSVLFAVYDYLLPIMLYCAWSTLALLDLARDGEADRGRTLGWTAAILAVPVVGPAPTSSPPGRASRARSDWASSWAACCWWQPRTPTP